MRKNEQGVRGGGCHKLAEVKSESTFWIGPACLILKKLFPPCMEIVLALTFYLGT